MNQPANSTFWKSIFGLFLAMSVLLVALLIRGESGDYHG